jgi:hypothetical protein
LSPGVELDAVLVRAYRWIPGATNPIADPVGLDRLNVPFEERSLSGDVYITRFDELFFVGPSAGDPSFPLEIAFAPHDRDDETFGYFEAYAVRCEDDTTDESCRRNGAIVTSTAARTTFARRKSVSLVLFLSASCRGVTCVPGRTTCRGGVCRDVEVSDDCRVDELDAGGGLTPMCEEDAGIDAGLPPPPPPPDAGVDAGTDAGVDAGAVCECTPGDDEVHSVGCDGCGTQQRSRTCDADCLWGGWSDFGACNRPDTIECDAGREITYDASCPGTALACMVASCTQVCDSECQWSPADCGSCNYPPGERACTNADGTRACHGEERYVDCVVGGMPGGKIQACNDGIWRDVFRCVLK